MNADGFRAPIDMSDAGAKVALLDGLPRDVGGLAKVVQGVLIHEHVAPAYGVTLSAEQHAQAHMRSVEKMLDCIARQDGRPMPQARPPAERVVGVCRHFTLLHVAMLRRQGVAARARCGFGAYFHKGRFVDHWVTEYWNEAQKRWVLVDAAPTILSDIPRKLGEYTHRYLEEKRGIEIHVGTTLTSFDDREAVLGDGTRIPARTLVWAAGVRPTPLLATLDLPLDARGRVTVDPTLQVTGTNDVWALGDCAAVPNERTPGRFDPPTCQHALRQARRLAKNLHGEPRPYGYRMLGQVATLGRYKGIAELPGLRLRGFLGWFVARTYHLYALPTFRRKARVVTDWTVSLFFRRDIVELSALGHPHRLDS